MNSYLRLPRAAFMTGMLAFAAAFPVAADTTVVTSIKPLELLVRAVATDDVTVTSLVAPGSSPHNYTLRPSQRRALEQADAIFWVGPDVESFLTRLLANDEFNGRTHQLMAQTDNRNKSATHADNNHSNPPDEHHADEESHSGHSEDTIQTDDEAAHDHPTGDDPHIWVDPQHALEMARAIVQTLSELDSTNAEALQQNLHDFEQRLNAREASIREQLEPLKNQTLFAYHSAFTRFAEHYGLQLQGVLTLNPALSPGAKHIAEVQNQLKKAGNACLLTEPQFNTQWWKSITNGLDITFSTWDPLATDIPATPEGYEQFQQSIADAVLNCR